jgi:hypothetical protein
MAAGASAQDQGAAPSLGSVEGQLLGHAEAGTPVVLLQYRLDAAGNPEGGPIARTETREDGAYLFTGVPIDPRTVYRLGTRIGGRLIASDPFTFPRSETRVVFNLRVPEVSTEPGALRGRELLWVAEPRAGQVWVTEVLHLENPTADQIDLGRAPLELPLPRDAQELEMLHFDLAEGTQERLGAKLLVSGRVPPGITRIAFRYLQPAPLGRVSWARSYAFPIDALRVLSPSDSVRIEGDRLAPAPPETYEDVTYMVWTREAIAPGEPLAARLSGIPISQWVLLPPVAGFAFLMAGIVLWFLWRRIGRGDGGGAPGPVQEAPRAPGSAGT